MVAMPTPTACPVVPPGSGRLNIMMMNENAANTESNGTICVFNARFMRCSETYQNGADAGVQRRASGRAQITVRDMQCRLDSGPR